MHKSERQSSINDGGSSNGKQRHLMLSLFWKSAAPTLQAVKINTISLKLIHFHIFPRSVFLPSSLPPSGKFKPCCGGAGESEGCSIASSLLFRCLTAKLDPANLYGLYCTHAQTQNSKIRRVFEKRRENGASVRV